MHKNVRFAVVTATAVVLAGVSYFSWSSAPPRIDPFTLMIGAKKLPTEQFDAH
jgi:hypothetical protein